MTTFSWRREDHRLIIKHDLETIEVIPHAPACVQVRALVDGVLERPGHMVIGDAEFADWSVKEQSGTLTVATEAVTLKVSRDARLSWHDSSGRVLLSEPARARELEPIDVSRYRYGPSSRVEVISTVDGVRTIGVPDEVNIDRKAIRYKQAFTLSDVESLYGLGQHEEERFDLRDCQIDLFQANMKSPAPVLLSTAGYGLLFDTAAVSRFAADRGSMTFESGCADSLSYFFIYGPDFDEIVRGIRSLTGQATMLPRWAFGYIQSRERYNSADELIEVADEFRRRRIPIDCLVQDWKYWPNDWWGEKSFDTERFPDPSALAQQLHDRHLKLMVSVWPNLRNGGPNHRALHEANGLLGDGSSYDAFQAEARRLYWDQAEAGIFRHGVDAWWCDSTEPFNNEWEGRQKPNRATRLKIVDESFNRYLDPADANAYALVHAKGMYEGQRAQCTSKRVVNLTRSAFPGQQRYGCVVWSGDISARWDVLRQQISAGLNFCATGIPYWTVDIGGFFVGGHECYKKWSGLDDAEPVWFWAGDYDRGADDLGYRELYVRWLQWGAFLPVMRSHGTDTPREPWHFGTVESPFYRAIVDSIKMRYRLLPYLYSLAAWQTLRSYTMMRLLAFDFRDDPAVHKVSDQYMLGPSLMICPVTEPMYYEPGSKPLDRASKTRQVYLPHGTEWFDFWSGRRHHGGQTLKVECPLDRIPVFARAGSIVPMGSPVEHSGEHQELNVRVFPGHDAEFELYNDEGDGYGYEKGHYTLSKLVWSDAEHRLTHDPQLSMSIEVAGELRKDKRHETVPGNHMPSGAGSLHEFAR